MRILKTFLFVVLLAWLPGTASANTYAPNTFADPTISTLNDATGAINGGSTVSLRSALRAADNLGGTHTVTLSTGTYALTQALPDRQITIGNTAQNITVNGNSPLNTIISMTNDANRDRILLINPSGTVLNVFTTFSGIRFTNGYLTSDTYGGGAIYAGGNGAQGLTITNCLFDNNIAPAAGGSGGIGGAINMFGGTLTVQNSTFTNNRSIDGDAGAIYYILQNNTGGNGAIDITTSTFSGNTAGTNGGAISFGAQGGLQPGQTFTVSIMRNTFVTNAATGFGGAITANNSAAVSTPAINFNRFAGNTSTGSATTSGLLFVHSAGSVNAQNNWWGCNTGPTAAGPCNKAAGVGTPGAGSLNVTTWLQLRNSASPATVNLGGTSTVTADILGLSSGGTTPSGNLTGLPAFPASGSAFGNAQRGTIPGASVQFINGAASVVFTATSGGAGGVDGTADGQTVTAPITVLAADLAVTKSNGVSSVTAGGSTTYTVRVTNLGPSSVTGALLSDPPAAGLSKTAVFCSGTPGACVTPPIVSVLESGTFALPTLTSGAFYAITVLVAVTAPSGSVSNTATVAFAGDPNLSNNSATDSDTLTPSANLGITKTDGLTTVAPGGSTTYTIVASNAGPSNTTATVADTFPASLTCTWTCVGAGGGTCTAAGGGNINDATTLPTGGSVTYTVSCSISGAASGSLSNTATVTGAATDPNLANNSATDTDTVTSPLEPAPSVTGAVTTMNTQTASGLVITTGSGATTHFKITAITNGMLFQSDGATAVANNDFITLAQGSAGLKFTPASGFTGNASFAVAADNGVPGTRLGPTTTANVLVGSTVAAGDLVIREFRTRGAAGAADEYIEITNTSAGPLTIASTDPGSTGFGIASEMSHPTVCGNPGTGPQLLTTIPNGTVIPAGGSFLAANTLGGYSLGTYGSASGGNANPNATWPGNDVCDNSGLALFNSSTTLDLAHRLDAVGFTGSAALYREGAGLSPAAGIADSAEWVYVRQTPYPTSGMKDTGDNAADFRLVSTAASLFNPGPVPVQSALGSPGPQNLTSPRSVALPMTLADPSVSPNLAPNRTQVGNYHYFRRMYTNNTGSPITSLRFRILALSTLWGDGYLPGGIDWRGISTTGVSFVPSPGPASVTAMGLTLEAPSIAYSATGRGGGYNASFTVDLSSLPLSSLANGASIYINIGFRNVKAGSFHFTVVPEIVN